MFSAIAGRENPTPRIRPAEAGFLLPPSMAACDVWSGNWDAKESAEMAREGGEFPVLAGAAAGSGLQVIGFAQVRGNGLLGENCEILLAGHIVLGLPG